MIKAILVSGSRATKMTTRFSDWDYLIFADDFSELTHIRMLLWERHYPKETHVNWGDEKTDEELYRSLCFSKLIYSRDAFYSLLMNRIYPKNVYPTYQEAQCLVARGRLDNVYRFLAEGNGRALRAVTTNLAHQRAKLLNWPLPEQKVDLVTIIINWNDRVQVFDFAESCVSDIEKCDTKFLIKPTLGYQRDLLGRQKGGRIRLRGRIY